MFIYDYIRLILVREQETSEYKIDRKPTVFSAIYQRNGGRRRVIVRLVINVARPISGSQRVRVETSSAEHREGDERPVPRLDRRGQVGGQ